MATFVVTAGPYYAYLAVQLGTTLAANLNFAALAGTTFSVTFDAATAPIAGTLPAITTFAGLLATLNGVLGAAGVAFAATNAQGQTVLGIASGTFGNPAVNLNAGSANAVLGFVAGQPQVLFKYAALLQSDGLIGVSGPNCVKPVCYWRILPDLSGNPSVVRVPNDSIASVFPAWQLPPSGVCTNLYTQLLTTTNFQAVWGANHYDWPWVN